MERAVVEGRLGVTGRSVRALGAIAALGLAWSAADAQDGNVGPSSLLRGSGGSPRSLWSRQAIVLTSDLRLLQGPASVQGVAVFRLRGAGGRWYDVVVDDAGGVAASRPAELGVQVVRALAIGFVPSELDRPERSGRLELADGRVLAGAIEPSEGDEGTIGWRHVTLGVVRVPIDAVRRIVLVPSVGGASVADPVRAGDDEALLVNGDLVRGVVVAVGSVVEVAGDEGTVRVPIESAAMVTLAAIDVAEPRPMGADMVSLVDGSVLRGTVTGWTERGPTMRLQSWTDGSSELDPVELDGQMVRELVRDVGGVRTLADLGRPELRLGSGRRWEDDVTARAGTLLVQGAELEVSGPASVVMDRWAGQQGADSGPWTLVARVELPEEMREWGDVEVAVRTRVAGSWEPVWSGRLDRARAWADVRALLPAGWDQIAIELGEGNFGPVQDVVRVERCLLLRGAVEGM